MPNHIIRYIWKYSKRSQLLLIALTFASFPLLYVSLEIPKLIINEVLSDSVAQEHMFLGFAFQPFELLMFLSFSLLALILINGLFKIQINTLKGKTGENLIRRLRYMLVKQLLKFPPRRFEQMPAGEINISVVQETDPLAGFASDAFVLPIFQGGTLLTILVFMFSQDWILGLASLALVPIQLFIIPRLQRQINLLRKRRIQQMRTLSSRVVETVEAIDEIRIQGTRRYTLAEFSYRFGALYKIRLALFKKKFFMKFLNNMLGHMTPFMFYAIGGYLILEGRLSIGALVAAIAAHKDFLNPWKELLNYYQTYHDNIIKYQQIIEHFSFHENEQTNNQTNHSLHAVTEPAPEAKIFASPIKMQAISLFGVTGETVIQNINLTIPRGQKLAIVASDSQQSQAFARILAGLEAPSQGVVSWGDTPMMSLPESQLRENIGFVNAHPYLFNASIAYNLGYALSHIPPQVDASQKKELAAAVRAGSSPDWFDETFSCVWTDLARLDAEHWDDVLDWIYEQMEVVESSAEMLEMSLHEVFDPEAYPPDIFNGLTVKLLELRHELREALIADQQDGLVAFFSVNTLNMFSTMEENLIFGTLANNEVATDPLLLETVTNCLSEQLILEESLVIAELVISQLLIADTEGTLSRNTITRFNLLAPEEIPKLQRLIDESQAKSGLPKKSGDKNLQALLTVFLKIIPADWPDLELSDLYIGHLLKVRETLVTRLTAIEGIRYYPFVTTDYNPGLSVMTNMLFGRIDSQCKQTQTLISQQINTLITKKSLAPNLVQLLILNNQAGVGGSRVPAVTRHTLSLARNLLKKPEILIMHEALSPLNQEKQARIINNIQRSRPEMTLVWIADEKPLSAAFDKVYRLNRELQPLTDGAPVSSEYPERPLSLTVSYGAGGATDFQARIVTMMAAKLDQEGRGVYLRGQPLVVFNRPGRGGQIAWNDFVNTANADGYELAVYNIPHFIAQSSVFPETVEYTIDNLEPIANWGADPAVCVVAKDSPFHSMADLIRFSRHNPGYLTLSGAGLYTGHHIAALQLDKAADIATRYVPGGGGLQALRLVINGKVQAGFNNLSDAFRYRDQLKILGVADKQRNTEFLPEVPTLLEQGIDVDDSSVNFRGIMAPQGTPESILDYLSKTCCAMFADKVVIEKMAEGGAPLRIMNRTEVEAMWQRRQDYLAELLEGL